MRGILLGLTLALALTAPAPAQTLETGDPEDCLQAYPAAVTPPPFADPIDVRVLVLLDGVVEGTAAGAMAAASAAYSPLAIRLKAVEYRPVKLTQQDASDLIAESRTKVGGSRPAGVDLVFTLTDKNMTGGVAGDAVAGQADCIGGVYSAETAFAVGEAGDDYRDLIAAHEMGHLMGAHHHYANCAAESLICTLMINDVGLASMKFSSLNGSIVRGHAEAYVPAEPLKSPPPADPEPQPQPQAQPEPTPTPTPAPQPQPQPQPAQPPAPPVDADPEAPSSACRAARAKLTKARRTVAAARKRVRRGATRPRTRALRRAISARDRAGRAVIRACD